MTIGMGYGVKNEHEKCRNVVQGERVKMAVNLDPNSVDLLKRQPCRLACAGLSLIVIPLLISLIFFVNPNFFSRSTLGKKLVFSTEWLARIVEMLPFFLIMAPVLIGIFVIGVILLHAYFRPATHPWTPKDKIQVDERKIARYLGLYFLCAGIVSTAGVIYFGVLREPLLRLTSDAEGYYLGASFFCLPVGILFLLISFFDRSPDMHPAKKENPHPGEGFRDPLEPNRKNKQ
jgi:hypothetical protein